MKKFYLHMLLAASVMPAGLMAGKPDAIIRQDRPSDLLDAMISVQDGTGIVRCVIHEDGDVEYFLRENQTLGAKVREGITSLSNNANKSVQNHKIDIGSSVIAYGISKKYAPASKAADLVAGYFPILKDNVVTNNVARLSSLLTAEDVDLAATTGFVKIFANIFMDVRSKKSNGSRKYSSKTIAQRSLISGATNMAASAAVLGAKNGAYCLADYAKVTKQLKRMQDYAIVKYGLNPIAYVAAQTCVNQFIVNKFAKQ